MATRFRWRLTPSSKPTRGREASSKQKLAQVTPLPGADRLGFDAWLLPPLEVSRGEQWIRRISVASGPFLMLLATGLLIWLLARAV